MADLLGVGALPAPRHPAGRRHPDALHREAGQRDAVFPVPDRANLKVVHEYHLYPQALAADADEPRIPENYQDVIVWRAVMLFCDRVKDAQRYDTAKASTTSTSTPWSASAAQASCSGALA